MNLAYLRYKHPEKEYPSKIGKKWSNKEENTLLYKLNQNMDIETISKSHERTVGGINCTRREIVYKLFLKGISIQEIMNQPKLDADTIHETIERREHKNTKKEKDVS